MAAAERLFAGGVSEINFYLRNDQLLFPLQSFSNEDHPLGYLANFLINSFSTAYINWKAKPIPMIADIAVKEFESVIERTFQILKVLFPAMPDSPTFVDEKYGLRFFRLH
jgi:hypothetical protein